MLAELDRQPQARAILAPALAAGGRPSHAYLFHGPAGSGKRAAARAVAAELLAAGAADAQSARARVMRGAHPDLTWVVPSGAHEILVSDIAEPVVAAASKTPFEASRRVFVIERVDELGDEAANRMLKTLEEPPPFVHLILLTDRVTEVLPTISSRCQLVRFDARPADELAAELRALGVPAQEARACARLSLGDLERARELASPAGRALRAGGEQLARAALAGVCAEERPWVPLLAAVRTRGEEVSDALERSAAEHLELQPSRERKRVRAEWEERVRRSRRRAETAALDLALQVVALWYTDLAARAWGAEELVRSCDRLPELRAAPTVDDPRRLLRAVELVEQTRRSFQLNVSEELACEALAYQLEHALGSAP